MIPCTGNSYTGSISPFFKKNLIRRFCRIGPATQGVKCHWKTFLENWLENRLEKSRGKCWKIASSQRARENGRGTRASWGRAAATDASTWITVTAARSQAVRSRSCDVRSCSCDFGLTATHKHPWRSRISVVVAAVIAHLRRRLSQRAQNLRSCMVPACFF